MYVIEVSLIETLPDLNSTVGVVISSLAVKYKVTTLPVVACVVSYILSLIIDISVNVGATTSTVTESPFVISS